MGLFVGASVITVFEFLDALLHNFFKMHLNNKGRQKGTPEKKPKPNHNSKKVRYDQTIYC